MFARQILRQRKPVKSNNSIAVCVASSRVSLYFSMSAAFFSLDRDWCFDYVNAEAERLLERPREDLLGRSIWEEFPDAVGSDFEVHYRGAVETGVFDAYVSPTAGNRISRPLISSPALRR